MSVIKPQEMALATEVMDVSFATPIHGDNEYNVNYIH
jgi:hypothetical protein